MVSLRSLASPLKLRGATVQDPKGSFFVGRGLVGKTLYPDLILLSTVSAWRILSNYTCSSLEIWEEKSQSLWAIPLVGSANGIRSGYKVLDLPGFRGIWGSNLLGGPPKRWRGVKTGSFLGGTRPLI